MINSLTKFAYLSIAAAIITISLKALAYFLTGSVGLLSDALESVVNLFAAIVALFALRLAHKPPDEQHAYGHFKAEYFSSIIEGGLIFVAALTIGFTAINRIINPQPIEQATLGIVISIIASIINFGVAVKLLQAGKKFHSITLEADAHHLFTDVWTSVGVVVAVAVVAITHITILDPLIALGVAVNIIYTGYQLIKRSALGFMDTSIPEKELVKINEILEKYTKEDIAYHALRSRQSGARKFMSVHILVPGKWSIQEGHNLLEKIEEEICKTIPNITVFTHIEPIEDPKSQDDISITREFT